MKMIKYKYEQGLNMWLPSKFVLKCGNSDKNSKIDTLEILSYVFWLKSKTY